MLHRQCCEDIARRPPRPGYIRGGAGGGIVRVNHCVFLSRDGERQLALSVIVEGAGTEFEKGDGRAAGSKPMNTRSSVADCVRAVNIHNV